MVEDKKTIADAFGIPWDLDTDALRTQYEGFAERIRPMVRDTSFLLRDAMNANKPVLFEGAQGTMLDIDHGTYPFVTSSSAAAGGACTGAGVPPTRINGVVGVSKAYITRVGGGPFPTEDHTEMGERIRAAGKEFGAVTGRPRRCGWFDVPLLQYTTAVNGFDSLIITKLDVLDELETIPVCVAYKVNGKLTDEMPATNSEMESIEAVYETLPGWHCSTRGLTTLDALPAAARTYLDFLQEKTGVEVGCVSLGPERSETIIVPGSKLERLLA
jgi:adenylosuccinate synthase